MLLISIFLYMIELHLYVNMKFHLLIIKYFAHRISVKYLLLKIVLIISIN
jgi:hypothetical protein